jgi:hypothetical protein
VLNRIRDHARRRLGPARRRLVGHVLAVSMLVALGVHLSSPTLRAQVLWTPDGLRYQAMLLEVRGASERDAIREAFTGPTASRLVAAETSKRRLRDLDLVQSTQRFYKRRRLLPTVGAAIYPVLGERSLQALSVLAYIAIGPVLYLLLRRRASWWAAVGVAGLVVFVSPVRLWSFFPLADSAGLLFMLVAGIAATSVLEDRRYWPLLWCAALAALSFTRETYVACLVAAAILSFGGWKRSGRLLAIGIASVAPALLLFEVPTRYYMDCTFNLSECSESNGWTHVLSGYPGSLWRMLVNDAVEHTWMTAWVLVGAFLLFRRSDRDDAYFAFWRAAFVGGLAMLALLPNPTDFRLEFVLLPSVAVGTAAYLSSRPWTPILRRHAGSIPLGGRYTRS